MFEATLIINEPAKVLSISVYQSQPASVFVASSESMTKSEQRSLMSCSWRISANEDLQSWEVMTISLRTEIRKISLTMCRKERKYAYLNLNFEDPDTAALIECETGIDNRDEATEAFKLFSWIKF